MAATAKHEMPRQSVAQHIHHTPSAAQRIKALSHTGSLRAQNSREVIERLAATVHDISHSVDSLAAESQSTQQAADMIGAIVVQAEAEHVVSTQPALDGTSQEDISQQITIIACVSDQNAELAKHSAQISEDMQTTAQALNAPIERFNR